MLRWRPFHLGMSDKNHFFSRSYVSAYWNSKLWSQAFYKNYPLAYLAAADLFLVNSPLALGFLVELAHLQRFLHWYSWCVDANVLHPSVCWVVVFVLGSHLMREKPEQVWEERKPVSCREILRHLDFGFPVSWRRHVIFILLIDVTIPGVVSRDLKCLVPTWLKNTGSWTGKLSTSYFLHPLGNQSERDYKCKLSSKLFVS